MRIAALYDIHGNQPALEAVLRDIAQHEVDRIVVGGDVLPGPMPRESLERLAHAPAPVTYIRGNGEAAVLAQLSGASIATLPERAQEAVRWSCDELDRAQRQHLQTWVQSETFEIPGLGSVLFCHATPRSDTEIFTQLTPEEQVVPMFAGVTADLVACGHTHAQFERRVGAIRVINAGSVGMPFEAPGAYWLLIGSQVELRRTTYDLEDAARRVRATRYPQAAAFAEHYILRRP